MKPAAAPKMVAARVSFPSNPRKQPPRTRIAITATCCQDMNDSPSEERTAVMILRFFGGELVASFATKASAGFCVVCPLDTATLASVCVDIVGRLFFDDVSEMPAVNPGYSLDKFPKHGRAYSMGTFAPNSSRAWQMSLSFSALLASEHIAPMPT